jgi:hypothetical protein
MPGYRGVLDEPLHKVLKFGFARRGNRLRLEELAPGRQVSRHENGNCSPLISRECVGEWLIRTDRTSSLLPLASSIGLPI